MLFNSYEFLLFFPIVTLLFFLLPHRWRWLHLLIASMVFYMALLPIYILVLAITIIVDYWAGIYIERSTGGARKWILLVSLAANIGFLCFFKYYDFFALNIGNLLHVNIPRLADTWLSSWVVHTNNSVNAVINNHLGTHLSFIEAIVLPVGLSFHTFQAMSYTIEVYKGRQKAERHFGIYALYVMFYPQLVAGPIERPQHMLHQFREKKYFSSENFITGARLMAWGLFKKVVIADRLSVYVDLVYKNPEQYHWLNLVIATLFFSIQIYCDFSGYSDIALGAARIMGYDLMVNFRRPYFATNIREFWSRWHISLTTWFRDYVYIPLGGNRVPVYRHLFNVVVVFLLSGLWHGANWTFVIWGGLHAIYMMVYLLFNKAFPERDTDNLPAKITGSIITLTAVCFAWIFFRAENMQQALLVIKQITTLAAPQPFRITLVIPGQEMGFFGGTSLTIGIAAFAFMIWVERHYHPTLTELNHKPARDLVLLSITITAIIIAGMFVKHDFIYFQF